MWVIFTDDATCCLLDTARCLPGLIDILSWELLQKRQVFSPKVEEKKVISSDQDIAAENTG